MIGKGKKMLTTVSHKVKKNKPTVYLYAGIFGMIGTCVAVGKASIKAHDILVWEETKRQREYIEAKNQMESINPNSCMPEYKALTPVDKVRLTWKTFVPSAILGVGSIWCLVMSNKESMKREAAVLGAYHLANEHLHSYEKKVESLMGEAKNKQIKEEIATEKAQKALETDKNVIINDSSADGLMWCYSIPEQRWFRSSYEIIKTAENHINERLKDEMSVCVNDFYDAIGSKDLPQVATGYKNGWNVNNDWLRVVYGSYIENGRYGMSIDYNIEPLQSLYGDYDL